MSSFGGKLEEIPDISVDRFDNENMGSSVYFLSHCHTDHMVGLSEYEFQKCLKDRSDVYLYTSSISISILRHKYPYITTKLKELPIGVPTLIIFPNDPNRMLTVTTISAGHCPGSVMFLFETDKNILYTGDYRVQLSDLKRVPAFYSMGILKPIHKIYLDTTFFFKCYKTFPLRNEIVEIVNQNIQTWLSKSTKHIVQINIRAKYGVEYLFLEIAKGVGIPIHVSYEVYNMYKCVPEMDKCVTLKGDDSRIHASCGFSYSKLCVQDTVKYDDILLITPSAMWWRNQDFSKGLYDREGRFLRVCYSCHASFEEINEFLNFLKPGEIEPCVVTAGMEAELQSNIESVLNGYRKTDILDVEVELNDDHKEEVSYYTPENVSDELNDLLGSPPKNFKRKRLWLTEDKTADEDV